MISALLVYALLFDFRGQLQHFYGFLLIVIYEVHQSQKFKELLMTR